MASGVIDFKFQNNMNNPVIVQTYITSSGQVKSNIWGIKRRSRKGNSYICRSTWA